MAGEASLKSEIRVSPFDAADYLDSPETMAAYIEAALEDGDPALAAAALGDVARAIGVSKIAEDAGVTRDTLYKSLRDGGNPTLGTFLGVMKSLGLTISVHAKRTE